MIISSHAQPASCVIDTEVRGGGAFMKRLTLFILVWTASHLSGVCTDAVIEETATHRVIGALSKGGREGHVTEREAAAKAAELGLAFPD